MIKYSRVHFVAEALIAPEAFSGVVQKRTRARPCYSHSILTYFAISFLPSLPLSLGHEHLTFPLPVAQTFHLRQLDQQTAIVSCGNTSREPCMCVLLSQAFRLDN